MNKFEYKIQRMHSDDIAEVENIAVECSLSFWSRADYDRHLENNDCISLVIKNYDEKIIGFITARLIIINFITHPLLLLKSDSKESDLSKCELEIYNIAVSRPHQSQGLGKSLLDKCVESIPNYKEIIVWLEVRRSNIQGVNFYLRNNFKVCYVRKNYYSQPVEDALVMRRAIVARV